MRRIAVLNPEDNGGEQTIIVSEKDPQSNSTSLMIETRCYGAHSTSLEIYRYSRKGLTDAIQLLTELRDEM